MASESSTKSVVAAVIANLAIAVVKFVAAAITGSSAMISEGIHSLVDTGNGLLLWHGIRQAGQPADETHPFGYGKELYFWALVVAVLVFAVGGGMSLYEGIMHLAHPQHVGDRAWSYWTLGVAAVFEGATLVIAAVEFRRTKRYKGVWRSIRASKDPSHFSVLFEDTAALLGIVLAFLGVFLGQLFRNPYFDGAASVAIGLLLMATAWLLARETRDLIVGEAADAETVQSVRGIVAAEPAVKRVARVMTVHFGPRSALLTAKIEVRGDLAVADLASITGRLEATIRERHPEIAHVFIQAVRRRA